jgi:hypothetical protein
MPESVPTSAEFEAYKTDIQTIIARIDAFNASQANKLAALTARVAALETETPPPVDPPDDPPVDPLPLVITKTVDLGLKSTDSTKPNWVEYSTVTDWNSCIGCAPKDHFYAFRPGAKVVIHFFGCQAKIYGLNDYAGATQAPVSVDDSTVAGVSVSALVPSGTTRAEMLYYDTGKLGDGSNKNHKVSITVPNNVNGNVVLDFTRAEVYTSTGAPNGGGGAVTAPSATLTGVTATGQTTATLAGSVNPGGSTTAYWFSIETDLGVAQVPNQTGYVSPGNDDVPISIEVTGLKADTAYASKLVATNSQGVKQTEAVTFKTSSAPVSELSRITIDGDGYQLNGEPFPLAVIDKPYAIGCGDHESLATKEQADVYFGALSPNSVTGIWMLPGMDLTQYQMIVSSARDHNQYLVVCLFGIPGECSSYHPSYARYSFNLFERSWVEKVVSLTVGDPVIAFYELITGATSINAKMLTWFEQVISYIKSLDSNVIVNSTD